jgi:hypothetical protein
MINHKNIKKKSPKMMGGKKSGRSSKEIRRERRSLMRSRTLKRLIQYCNTHRY